MAITLYMQQLNHIKYLDAFLITFRIMTEAMNYGVET